MSPCPQLVLNDGATLPQLGFGVFRIPDHDAAAAVTGALAAGYRGIDTASYYGNELGTGAALAASGLTRPEVHVSTKVWHTDLGYDQTIRALDASLSRLKLDYLDLYLIHWPVPGHLAGPDQDPQRRAGPIHRSLQFRQSAAGTVSR
jgi:2,5-diketo-D-gluconate reductase A